MISLPGFRVDVVASVNALKRPSIRFRCATTGGPVNETDPAKLPLTLYP